MKRHWRKAKVTGNGRAAGGVWPVLERLEDRRLLASFIYTTAAANNDGLLQVRSDRDQDGIYETVSGEYRPFPGVKAGITAVAADFDGDGNDELAVALAAKSPQVKIFKLGSDGLPTAEIDSFAAFDPARYKCGVRLSAGRFVAGGAWSLITAADTGGQPTVRIWSDPNQDGQFSDHGPADTLTVEADRFRGGIRVAAGDVDNDGYDELITAPGAGTSGVIRVYDDANHDGAFSDQGSYTVLAAYGSTYRNGLEIAAGQLSGLGGGGAKILFAPDKGALPLMAWTDLNADGVPDATINGGFPLGLEWKAGMRLAVGDINADGQAEVIVSPNAKSKTAQVVVLGDDASDADANPFNNPPLESFWAFTGRASTAVGLAVGKVVREAYAAANLPLDIPDNGSVQSSLRTGAAAGVVRGVTVTLAILHPHDGDLTVTLRHGQTDVVLFAHINDAGDGLVVKLDDAAATDIAAAAPDSPLTGSYNPQGDAQLSDFAGQSAAGLWTLVVSDDAAGFTGELFSWTLELQF
jgi:hypothetical protein